MEKKICIHVSNNYFYKKINLKYLNGGEYNVYIFQIYFLFIFI